MKNLMVVKTGAARARRWLSASLICILLGSSLFFISNTPAAAQTDNFEVATQSVRFSLNVTSGIQPVLTVDPESINSCQFPDGRAVRHGDSVTISFVTNEAADPSFRCTYDIFFSFLGFRNCTATLSETGSSSPNFLRDADIDSSIDYVIGLRGGRASRNNFRTGDGTIDIADDDGVVVTGGTNVSDLTVSVSGCEHSTSSTRTSFSIINPEPDERMVVEYEGQGNCRSDLVPSGEQFIDNFTTEFVRLDAICNWDINFRDEQGACASVALIYTTGNSPARIIGSRRVMQTVSLRGIPDRSASVEYNGNSIRALILYRSSLCSEVRVLTLRIDAPEEHQNQKIPIRIVATNTNRATNCTVVSTEVTAAMSPIRIFLRNRFSFDSSLCRYSLTVPEFAGALELDQSETLNRELVSTTSDIFTTIDYVGRRIPIEVTSVFPSARVFNTDERVGYRLRSPGSCRTSQGIFGTLQAGIGVRRDFQAFPGITQVMGENAVRSGGTAPFVYYMFPSIVVTNSRGIDEERDCDVEVFAYMTPKGCEIVGDSTQTVVAQDTNADAFRFTFVYSCDGETGVVADDSAPPVPPDPNNPTTSDSPLSRRITLPKGWLTFNFNGLDRTAPRDFLTLLQNSASKVYVWDAEGQRWKGYDSSNSNVRSLTVINKGDVVFVFVPNRATFTLSPGNLLSVSGSGSSLALEPGYNLLSYRGSTQAVGEAFDSDDILVVYRWVNERMDWESYFANDAAATTLINVRRGDLLFIYSDARNDITITHN